MSAYGLLLAACLWTLWFLPTGATDYYVDQSVGKMNNTCLSISFPCATISQWASLAINPGDTCHIRGGTYRETITLTHSGMTGLPITFKAYSP